VKRQQKKAKQKLMPSVALCCEKNRKENMASMSKNVNPFWDIIQVIKFQQQIH